MKRKVKFFHQRGVLLEKIQYSLHETQRRNLKYYQFFIIKGQNTLYKIIFKEKEGKNYIKEKINKLNSERQDSPFANLLILKKARFFISVSI